MKDTIGSGESLQVIHYYINFIIIIIIIIIITVIIVVVVVVHHYSWNFRLQELKFSVATSNCDFSYQFNASSTNLRI